MTLLKIIFVLYILVCTVCTIMFLWKHFKDRRSNQGNTNKEDEEALVICSPSAAERIKKDAPQLKDSLIIATWVEDSDSVMIVTSDDWDKFISKGTFLEAQDNPN